MQHNSDECSETGKRRFTSHGHAQNEMKRIRRVSRKSEIPKRAYHCEFCNGWHLTKQSETVFNDEGEFLE